MKEHHFDKTKGQSAIEYLMTYGWMLLVVAIVGGAIFATVQGQCTQSTSGFSGGDVLIDSFGTDNSNQTQIVVRNGGADTLTVHNATIVNPDSDGSNQYLTSEEDIGVGNSESLTLNGGEGISSSDGCNDFDLEFNYTMGQLDNQRSQGTLTDSIEFTGNDL